MANHNLESIPDDELKAELQRRNEERQRAHELNVGRFYANLTREALDQFVPHHNRTSCSDDDICNGWGTAAYGPRCNRCALLQALDGHFDTEHVLTITLPATE